MNEIDDLRYAERKLQVRSQTDGQRAKLKAHQRMVAQFALAGSLSILRTKCRSDLFWLQEIGKIRSDVRAPSRRAIIH